MHMYAPLLQYHAPSPWEGPIALPNDHSTHIRSNGYNSAWRANNVVSPSSPFIDVHRRRLQELPPLGPLTSHLKHGAFFDQSRQDLSDNISDHSPISSDSTPHIQGFNWFGPRYPLHARGLASPARPDSRQFHGHSFPTRIQYK